MGSDIRVSVVIPTLGTAVLGKTLDQLIQCGNLVGEVLVIYPRARKLEIDKFGYPVQFKFIEFAGFGQVAQRVFGLNMASFPMALQLDDDCLISRENLNNLVEELKKQGKEFALSPTLYDPIAKRYFGEVNKRNMLADTVACIIVGARFGNGKMGTVSKAGTIYPVNPKLMQSSTEEVEWLPGGCMLHWTNNLVLYNYYPFPGRACFEDIIHCFLLSQKRIKLMLCRDIIIESEAPNLQNIDGLYEMSRLAMKYLNVLRGKSNWRVDLWYFLSILRRKFQR